MSRRVKVAAVKKRLPKGTLSVGAALDVPERKALGRPRKDPNEKARALTVTLWPHEYEALEELRAAMSRDLPVEVTRSDLARLGFLLLVEMGASKTLRRLIKLKRSD